MFKNKSLLFSLIAGIFVIGAFVFLIINEFKSNVSKNTDTSTYTPPKDGYYEFRKSENFTNDPYKTKQNKQQTSKVTKEDIQKEYRELFKNIYSIENRNDFLYEELQSGYGFTANEPKKSGGITTLVLEKYEDGYEIKIVFRTTPYGYFSDPQLIIKK